MEQKPLSRPSPAAKRVASRDQKLGAALKRNMVRRKAAAHISDSEAAHEYDTSPPQSERA